VAVSHHCRVPSLKTFAAIIALAGATLTSHGKEGQTAAATAATTQIEVFFSPRGGCTGAVVRERGAARKTVLVSADSFTSAPSWRRASAA